MADPNGVYAALAAAQAEYPAVSKSHEATVNGEDKNGRPIRYTYHYADLADIMAAIRPVLSRHGLAVTQPIELLENGTMALRTSVVHGDGSAIHSMVPLPTPTAKPQAFGSALTFMRRYAYTSLLGIASEEDDDGSAAEQPGEVTRSAKPAQQRKAPELNGNAVSNGRAKSPSQEVDAALGEEADPLNLRLTKGAKAKHDALELALRSAQTPGEVWSLWDIYQERAKAFGADQWALLDEYVAVRIMDMKPPRNPLLAG